LKRNSPEIHNDSGTRRNLLEWPCTNRIVNLRDLLLVKLLRSMRGHFISLWVKQKINL